VGGKEVQAWRETSEEEAEVTNVEYVEVYEDRQGSWRWRAVAANGEIVIPPEPHTRDEDAERAARGVLGEDVEVRREDGD
jgi:uncharacterized protein YegP (UPF0339 family)